MIALISEFVVVRLIAGIIKDNETSSRPLLTFISLRRIVSFMPRGTIKISSEQPCTACINNKSYQYAKFRKIIAGYRLHSTLQASICESRLIL